MVDLGREHFAKSRAADGKTADGHISKQKERRLFWEGKQLSGSSLSLSLGLVVLWIKNGRVR